VWLTIQPRNERRWQADIAQTAFATVDDSRLEMQMT
jgi:hypothetical protein